MAINPNTQYPGKIATPDANYPYGGAQNITVPGDGTGTPWEAALLNDIFGFQQALLASSGIVPSGSPETTITSQYMQSIVEMISGRSFTYTAANANSIVLTPQSSQQSIKSYFTGLVVKFKQVVSNNTGVVTVNVATLGNKSVKDILGNDLLPNMLTLGNTVILIYDGVNFILQNPAPQRVLLGRQTANNDATIEFIDALDNPFYQYDLYYHNAGPSVTSVIFQMDLSDDSGGSWDAIVATLSTTMGTPSVADGKVKMQGASESRGTSILGEQSTAGSRGDIAGGSPLTKAYDSIRVKFNSGNISTGEFFLYGINQR